jgi:hypothetical protein
MHVVCKASGSEQSACAVEAYPFAMLGFDRGD